jgi:hypothetical protein
MSSGSSATEQLLEAPLGPLGKLLPVLPMDLPGSRRLRITLRQLE